MTFYAEEKLNIQRKPPFSRTHTHTHTQTKKKGRRKNPPLIPKSCKATDGLGKLCVPWVGLTVGGLSTCNPAP